MKNYFPTKGSAFSKFIIFLQFFYIYQVMAINDMGGFAFSVIDITSVLFSMFTLWLFFRMIGTWASGSKKGFLIANSIGITIYGLLCSYQFGNHQMAEWGFIADNFTSLFNVESINVVASSFDPGGLYYIPFLILLWGLFEWRKQSVSKGMQTEPLFKKGVIITLLYLLCVLMPISPRDPILAFFRSIWNYYTSNLTRNIVLPEGQYPFLKNSSEFATDTVKTPTQKPHVFLIVCESLNQSAVEAKAPNGEPVMPFLNTLKTKSVYAPWFYSNSIQTAKGHFSILFSTIPSIVGKEASEFTDIRLETLASVLANQGYTTTYFGAHKSKRFDNNFNFFTTHGFQNFVTSKTFVKPEDQPFCNNWGPQDRIFFKRFFEYFDAQTQSDKAPQFVMLTTIYNHFPFNHLKEEEKPLFKGKTSIKQNYLNLVHLTDQGLQLFFEELHKRPELQKNALVIVVGDHGFPLGEHGNYSLPAGYHEESFRVPFFMVWGDKLPAKQLEAPYSQLDIAPTVLDLVGIKGVTTNFQGTSVLGKAPEFIYLVQPYERQLSLIHNPYKYRLNTRLNKAYLYDLKNDPMEETNVINTLDPTLKTKYEAQIRHILLNQKAFEKDAFWPMPKI